MNTATQKCLCLLLIPTLFNSGFAQFRWTCSPPSNDGSITIPADVPVGLNQLNQVPLAQTTPGVLFIYTIPPTDTLQCSSGSISSIEYCYLDSSNRTGKQTVFSFFTLEQVERTNNSFTITGEFSVKSRSTEQICRGNKCCDRTKLPPSLSFRISSNASTSFGVQVMPGQGYVLLGYHELAMFNVNGFKISGINGLNNLVLNEKQPLRMLRFIINDAAPSSTQPLTERPTDITKSTTTTPEGTTYSTATTTLSSPNITLLENTPDKYHSPPLVNIIIAVSTTILVILIITTLTVGATTYIWKHCKRVRDKKRESNNHDYQGEREMNEGGTLYSLQTNVAYNSVNGGELAQPSLQTNVAYNSVNGGELAQHSLQTNVAYNSVNGGELAQPSLQTNVAYNSVNDGELGLGSGNGDYRISGTLGVHVSECIYEEVHSV